MRNAFLLGFKYKGENALKGILVDLYRMDILLQKRGWKTTVCCDTLGDNFFSEAIVDGKIPFSAWEWRKKIKIVRTGEDIQKEIGEKFWSLFYFTGHGQKGGFLLPEGETVPALTLLQWFGDNCPQLWIWDACGAYRLRLPYLWTTNGLSLNWEVLPWHLTDYPLTILSASAKTSQGVVSVSTENGSSLSLALSSLLEEEQEEDIAIFLTKLQRELEKLASHSLLQNVNVICSRNKVYLPFLG